MILTVIKKSTLFVFLLLSINFAFSQTNTITSSNGWTATVSIIPVKVKATGNGAGCDQNHPLNVSDYHYTFQFQVSVIFSGSTNNRSLTIQHYFKCGLGTGDGFTSSYTYTGNTTHLLTSGNTNLHVQRNGQSNGTYIYTVYCYDLNVEKANCSIAYLNFWGNGVNTNDLNGSSPGQITLNIGTSPLPIELIEFNAEAEKNQVNLNWKTASERNSDYFTIERTTDGENYEVVGTLKASGNSSTVKNYQFTDYSPVAGISYYRLTQTDFDGQSESFEVKSVEIKPTNRIITNVFPNPTQETHVNVLVQKTEQLLEMKIYSMVGQLIYQKTIDASQNEVIESVDLPEGSGTYLVELTQQGEVIGRHKAQVIR